MKRVYCFIINYNIKKVLYCDYRLIFQTNNMFDIVCSGCYQKKNKNKFLSKNIIRTTCNSCKKKKNIKKKQRYKEKTTKILFINDIKKNARLPSQLSNIIYESLLEISRTSEFLETLIEELPITLNKKKEVKRLLIKLLL